MRKFSLLFACVLILASCSKEEIIVEGVQVNTNFTVINIHGEELIQGELSSSKNSIDISNLASGTYHIVITTQTGVQSGVFVKK